MEDVGSDGQVPGDPGGAGIVADAQSLPKAQRRRLIVRGMLRACGITVVLVALYFVLPLDHLTRVPLWLSLAVGLLALAGVTVYEVRAILVAAYPAVKAIEALATTVPLFLLLFSACYFLVAQDSPTNFNVASLTRTDALYFTITVFATVGFGDIVAQSEVARLMVTMQMILDLVVLGLVVRVFVGAVQYARGGRQSRTKPPDAG
jgi:voltage-gated potassium channel